IKNGPLTPFTLSKIVHEMVRADYDQHFELDRPNLVAPDDETGIAWDSLVEGTATRIENRFVSALPAADKSSVQADQQRIAGQMPKDLPDYVLVQYAFPFGSGPKFADYLMNNGGAARVNAAFQHPPTTTEQIIHPEKFVAGEGPKAMANPAADAPAIRSGSLGQLMISLMLAQVIDPGQAETAADGLVVRLHLGHLPPPALLVDRRQPGQDSRVDVEARGVERARGRHPADRGVDGRALTGDPLQDPLEDPAVLAETGPEERAVL